MGVALATCPFLCRLYLSGSFMPPTDQAGHGVGLASKEPYSRSSTSQRWKRLERRGARARV